MKDIAIYGAGGYGREVACLINKINLEEPCWNFIGFFDDSVPAGVSNDYGTVLGNLDILNKWEHNLYLVFAIGSPSSVRLIVNKITNTKISFPNLFSPGISFLDYSSLSLGIGNIFCEGCFISCNVRIGNFNTFNDFTSIGHDSSIGDFNAFMTAVRISGDVNIGNGNYFGVNSCIIQGVRIGNDTTIAAGSAVLRRTRDGYTYMGVPASALIIK